VGGRVTPADQALDCGNSGSTMRRSPACWLRSKARFTLTETLPLSLRPMERIRKPLQAMGARITLTDGMHR